MNCVFCGQPLDFRNYCTHCERAACDSIESYVAGFGEITKDNRAELFDWLVDNATKDTQAEIRAVFDRYVSDPLERNRWRNKLRDKISGLADMRRRSAFAPHDAHADACEFDPKTEPTPSRPDAPGGEPPKRKNFTVTITSEIDPHEITAPIFPNGTPSTPPSPPEPTPPPASSAKESLLKLREALRQAKEQRLRGDTPTYGSPTPDSRKPFEPFQDTDRAARLSQGCLIVVLFIVFGIIALTFIGTVITALQFRVMPLDSVAPVGSIVVCEVGESFSAQIGTNI